jgi:hypothetical protein
MVAGATEAIITAAVAAMVVAIVTDSHSSADE